MADSRSPDLTDRRAAERWFLRHGLPCVLRPGILARRVWSRSAPALAAFAVIGRRVPVGVLMRVTPSSTPYSSRRSSEIIAAMARIVFAGLFAISHKEKPGAALASA